MAQVLKGSLSALALSLLVSCAVPSVRGSSSRTLSSQEAPAPVDAPKRNSSIRPSIAFGEISTKPDGGTESSSDALLYRLAIEFVGDTTGGGFRFWGASSDDDGTLFGPGSMTSTDMFGFYGHFTGRPSAGPVDLPIRVGLLFDHSANEGGTSEVVHTHIGGKIEFMPEYNIDFCDALRLTIFGGGQIGVAATIVSAEIDTLDDDEVTASLLYGFETGVRFTGKGFGAAVGYYNRTWDVDSVTFTDMPVPLTLVGQNQSFDGFMITVNVRW